MRVLLDTNVLLWLLADPDRIDSQARATLAETRVVLYLSAASAWEVAIKVALGKLDLDEADLRTWWHRALQALDARPLPVQPEHGLATAGLPPLHRDPFDRLLIAQALEANLTLATADAAMQRYEVPLLRC